MVVFTTFSNLESQGHPCFSDSKEDVWVCVHNYRPFYSEHMYTCTFVQLSNHVETGQKLSIILEGNEISVTCGMVVGARVT